MKIKQAMLACILIVVLLIGVTACGNKSAVSADSQSTAQQSGVEEETNQQATVQQSMPTPDPAESVESLVGEWVDISADDRFAKITKTDDGYQYEDNEGKYPGTYTGGVLKVKVTDTDTADVYIDAKTGHMLAVYQGGQSEFKKK